MFATAAGVLASIRRNALSGPKVVLQNTALNYATGGSAMQQGLAFPGPNDHQWLDSSKIEVLSFAPLAGCSAVTGGIHFDWTDADIASVDAIFTANWTSSQTQQVGDASDEFDIKSSSDFMEDSDWLIVSATQDGTPIDALVYRSKAVRVTRNSHLLFTRDTSDDSNVVFDHFSVEMEVLQINMS